MKFDLAILIFCCLSISIAAQSGSGQVEKDATRLWNDFKLKYGKVYENEQVELERRHIFERNLKEIDEFRRRSVVVRSQNGSIVQKGPSFTLGINDLSDRSTEELARMNGLRIPGFSAIKDLWEMGKTIYKHIDYLRSDYKVSGEQQRQFIESILDGTEIPIPTSVDWRKVPGRVSEVKNQGVCGSCWAFATVGLLEGQQQVRLNSVNATGLSAQNLVDCDVWNLGCDGGSIERALAFVNRQGGINDARSYPYESASTERAGSCRFNNRTRIISSKGPAILPRGDEDVLKEIVAKYGPVAAGINVQDPLPKYESGIYSDRICGRFFLNHAVLIVGYGTSEQGEDYWIIKNSWGREWGEDGYFRLARNQNNMCGIATYPVIAIF